MLQDSDKIIIAPELRDAAECAKWLFAQGDMRGFICNYGQDDEYLVVFDSYGQTHSSVARRFNFNMRGSHIEYVDLIFRVNGEIAVGLQINADQEFDNIGSMYTRMFIRRMYKTKNIEPRWVYF